MINCSPFFVTFLNSFLIIYLLAKETNTKEKVQKVGPVTVVIPSSSSVYDVRSCHRLRGYLKLVNNGDLRAFPTHFGMRWPPTGSGNAECLKTVGVDV